MRAGKRTLGSTDPQVPANKPGIASAVVVNNVVLSVVTVVPSVVAVELSVVAAEVAVELVADEPVAVAVDAVDEVTVVVVVGGAVNGATIPLVMTQQPRRVPAWPVVFESEKLPRPRSSGSACTTMARPSTALSDASESAMLTVATPLTESMLPRSPTCCTRQRARESNRRRRRHARAHRAAPESWRWARRATC